MLRMVISRGHVTEDIETRCRHLLGRMNIAQFANNGTLNMTDGRQQRAGVARALAM